MTNANIKAGDIVKVIDWGRSYSTAINWFLERKDKLNPDWLARYAFNDSSNYKKYQRTPSDNRRWEVLFVDVDNNLALITEKSPFICGAVYLIRLIGLSPLVREMTLSEIEAALGYPIKIIGEKRCKSSPGKALSELWF